MSWLAQKSRRPRLKPLADWLRALAERIYPEPTHTITITVAQGTRTFVNCRELRDKIGWAARTASPRRTL